MNTHLFHQRIYSFILSALLAASISGCTVGPNYTKPEIPTYMQDGWQGSIIDEQFSTNQPLTAWWQQFNDNQLNALIDELVSSNLALKQAQQRIVEASARLGVVGSERQIQLAAALGYTRAETGDDTVTLQGLPPNQTADVYSAGMVADWELDIWGRIARLLEAAEQDVRISYSDYRSMLVSLTAELALAYFDAQTLEARIATIHHNVSLQEKSLALAKNRYNAGNGTSLAVVRTERLLESTRARVPELERSLKISQNRITTLLSKPPEKSITQSGKMATVPDLIGLGLPAELLTRRPDIRQAYEKYHGAVARIGAAEAERYPSLSISGNLTLSSDSPGGVFNRNSLMYTLSPGINLPLFTGGRIESNIAIRNSQAEQARLALEQKIIDSLSEVETAAEGVVRSQQQAARLNNAAKLAAKSVSLANTLYREGLVDFFQVLDNEQQLVVSEESLLLAQQQALSEVVRLYRALGGGWQLAESTMISALPTKTGKKTTSQHENGIEK